MPPAQGMRNSFSAVSWKPPVQRGRGKPIQGLALGIQRDRTIDGKRRDRFSNRDALISFVHVLVNRAYQVDVLGNRCQCLDKAELVFLTFRGFPGKLSLEDLNILCHSIFSAEREFPGPHGSSVDAFCFANANVCIGAVLGFHCFFELIDHERTLLR